MVLEITNRCHGLPRCENTLATYIFNPCGHSVCEFCKDYAKVCLDCNKPIHAAFKSFSAIWYAEYTQSGQRLKPLGKKSKKADANSDGCKLEKEPMNKATSKATISSNLSTCDQKTLNDEEKYWQLGVPGPSSISHPETYCVPPNHNHVETALENDVHSVCRGFNELEYDPRADFLALLASVCEPTIEEKLETTELPLGSPHESQPPTQTANQESASAPDLPIIDGKPSDEKPTPKSIFSNTCSRVVSLIRPFDCDIDSSCDGSSSAKMDNIWNRELAEWQRLFTLLKPPRGTITLAKLAFDKLFEVTPVSPLSESDINAAPMDLFTDSSTIKVTVGEKPQKRSGYIRRQLSFDGRQMSTTVVEYNMESEDIVEGTPPMLAPTRVDLLNNSLCSPLSLRSIASQEASDYAEAVDSLARRLDSDSNKPQELQAHLEKSVSSVIENSSALKTSPKTSSRSLYDFHTHSLSALNTEEPHSDENVVKRLDLTPSKDSEVENGDIHEQPQQSLMDSIIEDSELPRAKKRRLFGLADHEIVELNGERDLFENVNEPSNAETRQNPHSPNSDNQKSTRNNANILQSTENFQKLSTPNPGNLSARADEMNMKIIKEKSRIPRSPAKPKLDTFVFATSNIYEKAKGEAIGKLIKFADAKMSKNKLEMDPNTTHLIVSTASGFAATPKLLQAIYNGIHVVHFQWVVDCLSEQRMLPEADYYPLECVGVKRRMAHPRDYKLFNDYAFLLSIDLDENSRSSLKDFTRLCGIRTVNSLVDLKNLSKQYETIALHGPDFPRIGIEDHDGVAHVSVTWFYSCIFNYQIQQPFY